MTYMRINMEKINDELTSTSLEIAKRLNIEVELIEVIDDIEFESYMTGKPNTRFTIFCNRESEDNYFYFEIEKEHMQYNFNSDVMYGFFECTGCSVKVNGTQVNRDHWEIVENCVEIHNKINYKRMGK